jgi:4-amino-4-deoxy-L-arabinose transferase-like glycosyltransferase
MPFSLAAIALLFGLYVAGISNNPPGFYLDESGMAYNAYLIAHTGAGEFGARWPLFFQFYTGGFTQYAGPTQIYLLALAFFLFPPSIVLARLVAAASVFAACLLLGYLAGRIGRRPLIGIIVGLTALLTPWLIDLSRLVLDIFVYPMAIVLFLLALYHAHSKERWALRGVLLTLTLALLTYTYTVGRTLGPVLAVGLLFFVISKQRLAGVIKTWIAYGITLVPLLLFNFRHPGQLMQRFYLISYVRPQSTLSEVAPHFIQRYLEDFSLRRLLLLGDINPRHHIPDSMGSMLVATFVLALIGIVVVLARHWRDPWWRFVLFGTAVSIVPGALTLDQFHTLRLVAYPIFLLVLTVPALSWLLEDPQSQKDQGGSDGAAELKQGQGESAETTKARRHDVRKIEALFTKQARRTILAVLVALTVVQGSYFQLLFHREGPKRGYVFDTAYKEVYDAATALPTRPIYLVDGYWGPAYIHALWYATLERRTTSEFIHQPYGVRPPPGSLVLSSEDKCADCQMILQRGIYTLYRTR